MGINLRHGLAAIGVATVLVSGVAACNNDNNANAPSGGTGASVDDGFKIGLLLPESKTTRYESHDRPLIEAKLKELCAKCTVLYQNADQDAAKQQSQAEAMLTQ